MYVSNVVKMSAWMAAVLCRRGAGVGGPLNRAREKFARRAPTMHYKFRNTIPGEEQPKPQANRDQLRGSSDCWQLALSSRASQSGSRSKRWPTHTAGLRQAGSRAS
jgi:hypothetical protein